jgi:hypothetical protein
MSIITVLLPDMVPPALMATVTGRILDDPTGITLVHYRPHIDTQFDFNRREYIKPALSRQPHIWRCLWLLMSAQPRELLGHALAVSQ